jgi:hypothetical protein
MKRALIVIIAALFVLMDLSCKKGEDDPVISLRTRKQRITGKWSLEKGNASLTIFNPGSSPEVRNFSFSAGKGLLDISGVQVTYYFTYMLNLEFGKKGEFKLLENFNGKSLNADGTWNFTGKIVEDQKNKEEVFFKLKTVSSSSTDDHLFNCLVTNFAYKIKELRNNKLVLYTYTDAYVNSVGERAVFQGEYTMVKN